MQLLLPAVPAASAGEGAGLNGLRPVFAGLVLRSLWAHANSTAQGPRSSGLRWLLVGVRDTRLVPYAT